MIAQIGGKKPNIPEGVYVAPSACVIGDVSVGAGSGIWFGAVLRGDCGPISVGRNTNIQDNCVVHADPGGKVAIGDNVTVGHCAVLHGCTISDNVLVGMSATILNGAEVGSNSIVGAGALVTQEKKFPERSLILGSPAKLARELTDEEVEGIKRSAEEYVKLARRYLPPI